MNQYICETCKFLTKEPVDWGFDPYCHISVPIKLDNWDWVKRWGCASHSDLQYDLESVTCKYCAARKQPLDILIEFDMWFSSHHVCGKYAEVSEVRQWIHNKISELRQEGNREKHSKDIGNVSKKDMIFTPVRHVDGE